MNRFATRGQAPGTRILFLLFGILLTSSLAVASSAPLTGVWSNQTEGFKCVTLALNDSGRGLPDSSVASDLPGWRPLANNRFEVQVHGNKPVRFELMLDTSSHTLALQGPGIDRQVLHRQPTALPTDPVQQLAERERVEREQRWKSFDQGIQRINLGPRKPQEIIRLWEQEHEKPGFVSLVATPRPLPTGISHTPPLLTLSRRNSRNFINLTIESAIDPRLPRSSADQTPFRNRLAINVGAVRYLRPENARVARRLLEDTAISYQERRFKLDYLQG